MILLKICSRCDTPRPYVPHACGVRWMRDCHVCNRARVRRHASTPEGQERERERARRRREEGTDYLSLNPEYHQDWRRTERGRTQHANSEAKRRAVKKGLTAERVDRLIVFDSHGGLCGVCGDPMDRENFHVDHIVPICKGGEHTYANVQPAHPICNISKGGALP
jgi:5-methylcytosine-specific restriction endonuclease McrA